MLDFKELNTDGNEFELLIREILFNMGMRVYWSGKGPDGGKDLLCVESPKSKILPIEKRWLVQCKHYAHAERAVPISDVGDIIDLCIQHDATGYLLVCSTYPSSTVVNKLEAINSRSNNLSAIFWDSAMLERLLSTPKAWTIAQRFFPVSSNLDGWRIYATENPNRWIINIMGYYIHLSNRIGSYAEVHLESIKKRINAIEKISMPEFHSIRPRAVYYDDKNGSYTWYVDYLYPTKEIPYLSHESIKRLLGHGNVLEDGQYYSFDVHIYPVNSGSDHYDIDHYDYYQPYLGSFAWGYHRKEQINTYEIYENENWELELGQRERVAIESFESLVSNFSTLDFVEVIRSENSNFEAIDLFNYSDDWEQVISTNSISQEQLFSALIIFRVTDENKLDNLMRKLPLSVLKYFRISKRYVYLPDMNEKETPEEVFDWEIAVLPHGSDKVNLRLMFTEYFNELREIIEKFRG
ncbi:Restriction endonuclease [Paenibacillus uliginis N3/975]|uniref:Restriction endonuclease n=1 Tax=Paenibacillus uliginis N3/975 TaxID=1313296 RepID=A0A1X7HT75_9BACL|nr:restriction endonuclease [Paenibacillus uliginis]SMF92270.1 Restriction endonuclease [Paenibacillus uliginis N3/975]